MKRCLAALALILAVAAPAARAQGAEPIEYRVNSWGRLVSAWSVDTTGAVRYSHFVGRNGSYFEGDEVVRRFRISSEERAVLDRLLAPAREASRKPLPCGRRITDAPYGRIAWPATAARIDFDFGCQSKRLRKVFQALGQASAQMQKWADARGGVPMPEQ